MADRPLLHGAASFRDVAEETADYATSEIRRVDREIARLESELVGWQTYKGEMEQTLAMARSALDQKVISP